MSCMLFASTANSAEIILIADNQQVEQAVENPVSCHGDSQTMKQQDSSTSGSMHMSDISAKVLHDCCMAFSPCLLPVSFHWQTPLQPEHASALESDLLLTDRSESPYKPPRRYS